MAKSRHIIRLVAAVTLMTLMACEKLPRTETCSVHVTVKDRDAATKVTGSDASLSSDEFAINSIQIIVYKKGGELDASSYIDGISGNTFTVDMEIHRGEKKYFCALVNSAEITPPSYNELKAHCVTLAENAPGNLVKYGKTYVDLIDDHDTSVDVDITIRKIAAKVVLEDITLTDSGFTDFHVNSVYLTNLNTSYALDSLNTAFIAPASDWAHRRGKTSDGAAVEALATDIIDTDIADGSSLGSRHTLYMLPNPVTTDSQSMTGDYTQRLTRYVIDTNHGYYHVDIPQPEPNCAYHITNVTIKGEGGPDPEHNPENASVSFTLKVLPWVTGASYSENI